MELRQFRWNWEEDVQEEELAEGVGVIVTIEGVTVLVSVAPDAEIVVVTAACVEIVKTRRESAEGSRECIVGRKVGMMVGSTGVRILEGDRHKGKEAREDYTYLLLKSRIGAYRWA